GEQSIDAEMLEQQLLRADHVVERDHREIEGPGLAGRRIDIFRARYAHAAAEHIGADQEIALGVENAAGSDHRRPPAGRAGDRMGLGGILVAGQRMADQDRVAALLIEFSVCLIGNRERAEIDPAIEPEGLAHNEAVARPLLARTLQQGCGYDRQCSALSPDLRGPAKMWLREPPPCRLGGLAREWHYAMSMFSLILQGHNSTTSRPRAAN